MVSLITIDCVVLHLQMHVWASLDLFKQSWRRKWIV